MTNETDRVLRYSDAESRRFGLRIMRGVVGAGAGNNTILEELKASAPDVVIFRCDAGDTSQISTLVSAGLIPLHADTLVYYSANLSPPPTLVEASRQIRTANDEDATALSGIIRRSFVSYRNHYHANPLFSPEAILDGYVEWALDYAIQPTCDQQTWLYCLDNGVCSFATCRLDKVRQSVEIVLNATDPSWSGRGFYSKLLRHLLDHYGNLGFSRLMISTQIWNYAVQRVWTRAGLTMDRAYDTYHINIPHAFVAKEEP